MSKFEEVKIGHICREENLESISYPNWNLVRIKIKKIQSHNKQF